MCIFLHFIPYWLRNVSIPLFLNKKKTHEFHRCPSFLWVFLAFELSVFKDEFHIKPESITKKYSDRISTKNKKRKRKTRLKFRRLFMVHSAASKANRGHLRPPKGLYLITTCCSVLEVFAAVWICDVTCASKFGAS